MKRRILSTLSVCLLIMAILLGCTPNVPDTTPTPNIPTLAPTDEPVCRSTNGAGRMGRGIKLDGPASKVVALTAADCEIIYALGAGDALVGRGEYCNYPQEVLDVVAVQSGYETNVEQIIALNPDVVIMSSMDQSKDQVNQLEDAGINVVVSNADDIKGVYTCINLIGAVMGKTHEADALVKRMKDGFAQLAADAEGKDATVYFEVSPLQYGLWTAGKNTFMDELAQMLGVKNCFDDVDGWAQISEEQVIERNPDYIVTISMYFGEGPTPVEEILSRKGWEDITAVMNNAVLNLQNDELSRPGPRLLDGARALYEVIYGKDSEN